MSTRISGWVRHQATELRDIAPFAAVALTMPGGTVLAALLWLCRHHPKRHGAQS